MLHKIAIPIWWAQLFWLLLIAAWLKSGRFGQECWDTLSAG